MRESVKCISLKRAPEEWTEFQAGIPTDWPFGPVEKFPAVDGKLCPPPGWWHQGHGAWGCRRSHLAVIEDALSNGINSLIVFEDDAVFCNDFAARWVAYRDELPSDWGMAYLGGQHLYTGHSPPVMVSPNVYTPFNVNRTHAYAIRGAQTLRKIYQHLSASRSWNERHHIDHHLGKLCQQRTVPIYTPARWLVGQRERVSSISGRVRPTTFYNHAENLVQPNAPFLAVLGTHSSGSSCIAGVLARLGVHMGNKLTGHWGGEAAGLARLCERAMPFPSFPAKAPIMLHRWIGARAVEAADRGTIAGGKYPTLCNFTDDLLRVCGDKLRVIDCARPLAESVASIIRRAPKHDAAQLSGLQEFLHRRKTEFLATRPDHHKINFDRLRAAPRKVIGDLVGWLGIHPIEKQIKIALDFVR